VGQGVLTDSRFTDAGLERRGGALLVAGVSLADIAREVGTPVYVYNAAAIRQRYRALDAALADVPHRICYAVKANSTLGVLRLLRDLGARGARFARELDVDVVVGAETAGVPLATAVSLAGGLPFAFVRKPGYKGHETDEPPVRGADVAGKRVLLVDDAVSSGSAVERFAASLASVGAEVVGVFVLVDMREVADHVSPVAAALPTQSVTTYLEVLRHAAANGVLDPVVHDLTVDAMLNRWTDDDPRWDLLPAAA